MLRFLFQQAGIDYSQWAALTKTFIKKDFRESSMSSSLRHGRSGKRTFLSLIFFYLMIGLVFIPIIVVTQNAFISATLLITYTMFMIGGLILVEYHSVVISPDDYNVLGYRPIDSRTFFVVKLTNLLFYVLTFSTVLSLPALFAFTFSMGFKPALGAISFISIVTANFATGLSIILLYTFILKRVSINKLQNILAIFQIGLALLIYSSFFVLPKIVENAMFQTSDFANASWFIFLPSVWFSSYIEIFYGNPQLKHFLLAVLSILLTGMLGYLAVSRLSMGYSENLAALTNQIVKNHKRRRKFMQPFFLFAKAHEERVVSKLIRSQFLHDNKFKMAVLGILPLTLFYLFVGVEDGPLPNPFVTAEIEMSRSGLLYLLVFLFPMMLRTYVTQSDAYQASWIFYATPANVKRLILSEKNFLMIYFVLPFLMILGAIFYYYFENVLHVLLHTLVLGLLAHLFLQFAFLYSPDLPFSRPNVKGRRSRNLAMFLILVPFIIYFLLPMIFKHVYNQPVSFFTFTVTMLVVSVILESLIPVRVTAYMKKHEYSG